jgi:cytochrome c oxidase subunit 3
MSNIFTEQPWIADTGPIAPALSGAEIAMHSRRSALKVLLSVVSIFFMLMIVAYGGRMLYQDWQPTPQISLLWANTGLLLLSSLCLQAALMWARADKVHWVRGALVGAGVLTVLFLAGQLTAWQQLTSMVLGDFSNPSVGFFFMITGIHGLHMAGGMVAGSRMRARWSTTCPTARSTGTTCWAFGWWCSACCSQVTISRSCSGSAALFNGGGDHVDGDNGIGFTGVEARHSRLL